MGSMVIVQGRPTSRRLWDAWCSHRAVIIISPKTMSKPEVIEVLVLGLETISFICLIVAIKLIFSSEKEIVPTSLILKVLGFQNDL